MIAAFLKSPDGKFDFRQVIALLFCVALVCFITGRIYQDLKTGRIMFSLGMLAGPICYAEREKSPVGFWCVVACYLLGIALTTTIAITICFLGSLGKMTD
jgi:hypothetical protein